MRDLMPGRFQEARLVHGAMMTADGAIKTIPLCGIKDALPYLHDGRLLILADTAKFFNLILGTHLTTDENQMSRPSFACPAQRKKCKECYRA